MSKSFHFPAWNVNNKWISFLSGPLPTKKYTANHFDEQDLVKYASYDFHFFMKTWLQLKGFLKGGVFFNVPIPNLLLTCWTNKKGALLDMPCCKSSKMTFFCKEGGKEGLLSYACQKMSRLKVVHPYWAVLNIHRYSMAHARSGH